MAENEPRDDEEKLKHRDEVLTPSGTAEGIDPDVPATDEELARADALRAALDDPSRPSEDAELLRALALAAAPRPLPAEVHEALVAKALGHLEVKKARQRVDRRGVVVRVTFGAAALLAAAAAVLLVVGRAGDVGESTKPALARVRSTQALFDQPFERGQASLRADRIAVARTADLRENRFASWGVK